MKCPIDGTQLVMTDRSGVEIDYCPSCRGVWLDRGELDKIIERSAVQAPQPQRGYGAAPAQERPRYDDAYKYKYKGKRRKKGVADFLDDIFDF